MNFKSALQIYWVPKLPRSMVINMIKMHVWSGSRNWSPYHGRCEIKQQTSKRGEVVETITGLHIERVPRGLSSCFWELLSSPDVASSEW